MGCLSCRTKEGKESGRTSAVDNRSRSRTLSLKVLESWTPEAVQSLTVTTSQNQHKPSVILKWEPPANCSHDPSRNVLFYYIKISSKISNQVLRETEVDGNTMEIELSEKDKVEPLEEYIFSVQAKGSNDVIGDLNMVDGFVEWHCRLPECTKSRMKLEDGIYDFCSRNHKVDFDERYCLYPGCQKSAVTVSPTSSSSQPQSLLVREMDHFCSHDHYYQILKKERDVQAGFFVEVDSGSQEYREIEEHFQKKWKKYPNIALVLAIINPSLNEQFTNYKEIHGDKKDIKSPIKKDTRSTVRKDSKNSVKKFFFGTKLGCDLQTYQVPCKHDKLSGCDVCHLALNGFEDLCIDGMRLDKNPEIAHSKAKPHEDSFTYGLLLCDVVCGSNMKKVKSAVNIQRDGFDAVGISKGVVKNSTDEIVLYNAKALCPRYILLYV